MEKNFDRKILLATKWSSIAEILAKLINPITNMILARLLAPEEFGVVATITMIVSFVDMFTDSGFQKYIVQHEFKDDKQKFSYINVAFWTNLFISIILWVGIILFSDKIAILVGNPGLGHAISIACIQLPLTSFSSIQMSIFRRNLEFKSLLFVRIIGILIPLFVTVPLAIMGWSYWALIIASILSQLSNALILTIKSEWKPTIFYKFKILKEMISFSIWSLIEAISIWVTVWIDAFIIGIYLNEYHLGLYKTSTTMVNGLLSIITASILPVLFSSLSRLQNDEKLFKNKYYNLQKIVAYIVFPMSIGIFIYRDFATNIFLGEVWKEASNIIGIWVLTSAFSIVFSNFNSEVYRAKGKPKISFIVQVIHLCFLIPTCIISLEYGFWAFVYARSLIRLQSVITGFVFMKKFMGFSWRTTLGNVKEPIIYTILMGTVTIFLKQLNSSIIWSIMTILLSIAIYLWLIFKFSNNEIIELKKILLKK